MDWWTCKFDDPNSLFDHSGNGNILKNNGVEFVPNNELSQEYGVDFGKMAKSNADNKTYLSGFSENLGISGDLTLSAWVYIDDFSKGNIYIFENISQYQLAINKSIKKLVFTSTDRYII